MRHAFIELMRFALPIRIVAAVTALALSGAGAAQAALLACGPEMSMKSCCCAKGDPSAPQPSRFEASERACCSVTPAPARHEDAAPQATLAQPAPILVAIAAAPLTAAALQADVTPRTADPPRSGGQPILRTTCSLLI